MNASGEFYDGKSAQKHLAQIKLSDKILEISAPDAVAAIWPLEDVRRVDFAPNEFRLRCLQGPELARLVIIDPALRAAIEAACPKLDQDLEKPETRRKIVIWSLAAAAAIAVTITYGVPWLADKFAVVAPYWMEEKIGDVADAQFRTIFSKRACDSPRGAAAYLKLVGKVVQESDMNVPIRANVLDSSIPNAVALPGGKVYFFRGLIDKAESPDEIAGVLAHELGHVKNRDSMRMLAQTSGSSFLFGLLFGDIAGVGAAAAIVHQVSDASYSRQAEYAADSAAIDVLGKLGRPATPMGDLMMRITGRQGDGLAGAVGGLASSHPFTETRQERFAAVDRAADGRNGPPLLSAQEWRDLKAICKP